MQSYSSTVQNKKKKVWKRKAKEEADSSLRILLWFRLTTSQMKPIFPIWRLTWSQRCWGKMVLRSLRKLSMLSWPSLGKLQEPSTVSSTPLWACILETNTEDGWGTDVWLTLLNGFIWSSATWLKVFLCIVFNSKVKGDTYWTTCALQRLSSLFIITNLLDVLFDLPGDEGVVNDRQHHGWVMTRDPAAHQQPALRPVTALWEENLQHHDCTVAQSPAALMIWEK